MNNESSSEPSVAYDGIHIPMSFEQLKEEIAKGIRALDEGRYYDEETVFAEVERAIDEIE